MANHFPDIGGGLLEALDLVFTPKRIARQLIVAAVLEASVASGKHDVRSPVFCLLFRLHQ